jgi:RNA polymerase sigma-70 factor (ECF subfamily)
MDDPAPGVPSMLEQISTRWPLITNPPQFVLRYAPAVRRYLAAIIKDPHDAEDVAQGFLLRLMARPFAPEQVRHGRFRDYLKAALRNEAASHFRRQAGRASASTGADLDWVPAPDAERSADREWQLEWRGCLLGRAWAALELAQREAPEGLAYLALRLAVDHPEESSAQLAARAAAQSGKPIRPDAYRKQLSRARRRFAEFLIEEVRQTLERPGAEDVRAELADLQLLEYVRDYLP